MPKQAGKKKNGKALKKKALSARKAAGKKAVEKKTIKNSGSKKAAAKSVVKKAATKPTAVKKRTVIGKIAKKQALVPEKTFTVEPGPQPVGIPPVEEPAAYEEALGVVTHYYSDLGVAVVQLNKGTLRTGDTVHFSGHTTDFTQILESMEYEHRHVEEAEAGQKIGIKVTEHAREHDILYRVK